VSVESEPGAAEAASGARRASVWRNPDFVLLWSGQVVSTLGSQVSGIAFPLLVLALTHSPEVAGVTGALFTLPYVVLSLPAGALVDRWDRKRVMIVCDSVRAVNMASIPAALALDALTVWQIYLVALVEGAMFVFFNVAEVAALPRVVPRAQLAEANSQNLAAQATASLIGPAAGGFLFQAAGRAVPFLADAVSYAVSVAALLRIRSAFQLERRAGPGDLRREIGEGLGWLRRHGVVLFMAFITGGINCVLAACALLIIVLAQGMGAGDAAVGAVYSAGAVGSIAGALLAGRIQRRFSFAQVICGSVLLLAVVFPCYLLAGTLPALGAVSALLFFCAPIYSVASLTYRVTLIPDALQGRVNSSFRLIAFGFQPLGSAAGGILLERLGAAPTVVIFSGALALIAGATLLNPQMRRAGTEAPAPEGG
jgi:MFS family permease